jgi:pimeloyl-ACP methyl ester carboxylesterase
MLAQAAFQPGSMRVVAENRIVEGNEEVGSPRLAGATRLVYRQNLMTRITHWLWAICLFFLLLSGLQIFNAHPTLYLGDQSGFSFDNEVLAIYGENTPVDEYFPAGGVPVLDLQAEHDAVVIPNLYLPLLGADRVTEEVIRGAGHALLPERPAECADAIIRFAASIPSRRS